jgi:hypothetical protein
MTIRADVTQEGVRTLIVDPGNASRYVIILARLPDEACRALGADPGSFLVAVPNQGSKTMLLSPDGFASATYIHEKLALSWRDAEIIEAILQSQCAKPSGPF